MRRRIALLPGDGVGREVVPVAARALVAVAGEALELLPGEVGWGAFERTGSALPEATLDLLAISAGALLGAVASPSRAVPGYRSPVVELRRRLDLYANVRPLRSADGAVDFVLVRENTEGLYAGRERFADAATAIAERVVTRGASERIARAALELARGRRAAGRPGRLTVVHKANVLRLSDGLFRERVLAVAAAYPDVEVEEQLVDSMAYRLVREPARFDVVVTTNLYGDILSDVGAAAVGGLGVAAAANRSDAFCLAEPVHGSAPDLAGRGVANPVAALRAATLLLEHLGLGGAAGRLAAAVDAVLAAGPWTLDLGGAATTGEVAAAVLGRLVSASHGSRG